MITIMTIMMAKVHSIGAPESHQKRFNNVYPNLNTHYRKTINFHYFGCDIEDVKTSARIPVTPPPSTKAHTTHLLDEVKLEGARVPLLVDVSDCSHQGTQDDLGVVRKEVDLSEGEASFYHSVQTKAPHDNITAIISKKKSSQ